jgi:hypothetical protein
MLKNIVFAALLGFVIFGTMGCFYASSTSNQPAAATCDPGSQNCQTESKGFWGFVF